MNKKNRVIQFISENRLIFTCGVVLLIIYSITRLIHLTSLPIFTDEAIYIRWAQIAKQDSAQRFISLTDGKQPLFIWAMFPFFKLFSDPLVAGRIVSVCAGFGSIVGLFFLGYTLFKNKWVGFMASVLYVLYPLVLVHDRMALYDSMVGMFFVWGIYFTVLLARYIRLDTTLILSMVVGAGLLTKSSNEINLALFPFSLLLFDWRNKNKKERFFRWLLYAAIAAALSLAYYSILRLSPWFYIITQKNATFNYPLREWFMHPFTYFFGNFNGYAGWLITYLTLPVILLIISAFFIRRKNLPEKIFLLIAFLMPFTYAVFFGRVLYPRYLLFMSLPLLILAAYAIVHLYEKLKSKLLASIVIFVLLLQCISTDVLVLTNFATAPIPLSDRIQYINGWSAGGGVKEAVAFFSEQAKKQKIYVGTEGTFGLMPFALQIYLIKNPNIIIDGYWPITDAIPKKVLDASKSMPTYFLFYQPCPSCVIPDQAPAIWHVTSVLHVQKGVENNSLTVYQVLPQ